LNGASFSCLSDNGSNYTAALIKNLCELMQVKKITSTSFYSRGNANAERHVQKVTYVLRTLVESCKTDWTELLQTACCAINSTVSTSTGNTPFFLNHWRDFRYCFESYLVDNIPAYITQEEFLEQTHKNYVISMDHVIKTSEKRDQRNKKIADKKAADISYVVGELVWVYKPSLPDQLKHKIANRRYYGPFRIITKVNDNCYDIKELITESTQRVNVNRLKPYHGQLLWASADFSSDEEEPKEQNTEALRAPSSKHTPRSLPPLLSASSHKSEGEETGRGSFNLEENIIPEYKAPRINSKTHREHNLVSNKADSIRIPLRDYQRELEIKKDENDPLEEDNLLKSNADMENEIEREIEEKLSQYSDREIQKEKGDSENASEGESIEEEIAANEHSFSHAREEQLRPPQEHPPAGPTITHPNPAPSSRSSRIKRAPKRLSPDPFKKSYD
jgi:adenylate kinase family enzyme